MAKAGTYLVVVESPAKAKTIKKYLGAGYDVKASVGHIKDLPKSKMGVDVKKGFEAKYEVLKAKIKVLAEIKTAAKKSEKVFIATDPDREGEAIAWHIAEEVKKATKNGVDISRVLFNEITKKAIQEAIKNPRELDRDKYDSQQARRILDRLVGYEISPLLWNKVRRGLSAGRVQSVAVRQVVERERAIQAFVPAEYWTIEALLEAKEPPPFKARLVKLAGKKAEVTNESSARELQAGLERETFRVSRVEKKERRRWAAPPFITSKLQQAAANNLGFTAKKTMTLAQMLYEGIELGEEGSVALITYMRTDSVRLSNEAVGWARELIAERYGKEYVPAEPTFFKSKKGAQDAHEAIRPTSPDFPPERVKKLLGGRDRDMARLYELIWNRFIACQMPPAVYDQTTADVEAGKALFRATGQQLKFAGWLGVYGVQVEEEQPEKLAGEEEDQGDENAQLPPLEEGMTLKLSQLLPEQHFTQPPPRFTEASLVKELEEDGIGRPSTYAAILSVIQDKEYVKKVEGRFQPTELGVIVTDLLVASFPRIMDAGFTAKLEEDLDEIEDGKMKYRDVLTEFYGPFKEEMDKAHIEMRDVKREETATDLVCEKDGGKMVIKWGRRGKFLACANYPDCKNTMDFVEEADGKIRPVAQETWHEPCHVCGSPMVIRRGRFGKFIACSKYPECKTSKPIPLGVPCPLDGGPLAERRSKRGRTFYGCTNYPNCKFASWDKPINEKCPQCGRPYLLDKYTKRDGAFIACVDKECGYRREKGDDGAAATGDAAPAGEPPAAS